MAGTLLAPCRSQEERHLGRLVAGTPPALYSALCAPDDQPLRAYSLANGNPGLREVFDRLNRSIDGAPAERFAATRAALLPRVERVARRLAEDYDCRNYYRAYEDDAALTVEEALARARLRRLGDSLRSAPGIGDAERLERLRGVVTELERNGDEYCALALREELIWLNTRLENVAAAVAEVRRGVRDARALEYPVRLCQTLGHLGIHHGREGRVDSMLACWEEAREIAMRCRLPDQAARILGFESAHYARNGYLALAEDLHRQAEQVCREFHGGVWELRFVVEGMVFAASLGAWEQVEQLLQRARVLVNEPESAGFASLRQMYASDVDAMQARYWMARGEVERANTLFRRTAEATRGEPKGIEHALLLRDWADGLLANGRAPMAAEIAEEAARHVRDHRLGEFLRVFLLLADARLALGDTTGAAAALNEYDAHLAPASPSLREATMRATLEARLEMARGDRERAAEALASALDGLHQQSAAMDASEYSDLALRTLHGLMQTLHAFSGRAPETGYRIDLAWRKLVSLSGPNDSEWARRNRDDACVELRDLLAAEATESVTAGPSASGGHGRARPEPAADGPPEAACAHWCYLVGPQAILRWSAGDQGVRLDTLAAPVEEVRARAGAALRLLAEDGDRTIPPELERLLEELARALLSPDELNAPGAVETMVAISPDDFLRGLPFEVLDLRPGPGYQPLLARRDVAYVRFDAGHAPALARGPAVVVSDPELPSEIRRRYPALAPLARARREAHAAGAAFPEAILLEGRDATKEALARRWERAPLLYFAAHVIGDPEVPFRSFLPLAADGARTGGLGDRYLSVQDVRGADLSACGLVVLSACTSGVPSTAGRSAAPGLADGFLDAGARAVIQTLWRVRDEDAESLMLSFLSRWTRPGESLIHALCEARREAFAGPDGPCHPATWGAYAIQLGGLPSADFSAQIFAAAGHPDPDRRGVASAAQRRP